jgi:hypothetical protein
MKTPIAPLLAAFALAACLLSAVPRAHTEEPDWNLVRGKLHIAENRIVNGASEKGPFGNGIALSSSAKTEAPFRISVSVVFRAAAASSLAGIAFHVQDGERYYVFRMNSLNLVQFNFAEDGEERMIAKGDLPEEIVVGRPYRMEVASEVPGVFRCKVIDTETDAVLYEAEALRDPKNRYTGGLGGVAAASKGKVVFENFTFEAR